MDRERNHLHENDVSLEQVKKLDSLYEGRDKFEVDIDRMVNEGLGAGYITNQNGLVDDDGLE